MQKLINLVLLASFLAVCISCSLFGGGNDEPVEVQVTVSVAPENSGSVNFSSRTFLEGDTVTVVATANNGFSFTEWTGSRPSSQNPYEFIVNSDTDLTANFLASSSNFEMTFLVSDDVNTQELRLGLIDEASDGFDAGFDLESPPPPPQDALHAYFMTGSMDLLRDYRNVETPSANWQLSLQPSPADSITFSWDLNSSVLNGSLIFSLPDISEQIDMTQATEIKVHRDETGNLSVDYELGQ